MFTRTKDRRTKIGYDLEVLSKNNNYIFETPGTGKYPYYIKNPEIRLQKWGGNLRDNALNIEHDLFGQTRKLNRDDINLNNYVPLSVNSGKKCYGIDKIDNQHQRLNLNIVDSKEKTLTKKNHSLHILLFNPQDNIFNQNPINTRLR
tara:strand:+ start:3143 stop:3583 length:441 start_codon:yes stop_codon:yes gene_type:complete